MQGKFKPKNPGKYIGNPTEIIYRSTWELHMMQFFDTNEEITGWGSEELAIPYRSPLDGRVHRYFPDMIVKKRDGDIILVEIKPYAQTQKPEVPAKKTKAFLNEAATYVINQAKWEAADQFCRSRGWKFQIMTEKEIYGK
jgi:TnsA endonuclease N terminal